MAPGSCASSESGDDLHTVIYLDVDGVLNVTARDGRAALLFSEKNLQFARMQAKGWGFLRPTVKDTVERLISIAKHKLGHGEGGTYAALATRGDLPVAPVLVERVARLIRAAGPRRTVVLASSWRLPKHKANVARLEREISRHLGEEFTFDARTPIREDGTPQQRLECIGDSIRGLAVGSEGAGLRVLVLDDFFGARLQGLSLGGEAADSAEGAERYLQGCCQASGKVSVRVVQPLDEWATSRGTRVQVGMGLTTEHFCRAMCFLDADAGCGCCDEKDLRVCRHDSDLSTAIDEAAAEERLSQGRDSDASGDDEAPVAPGPRGQESGAGPVDEAQAEVRAGSSEDPNESQAGEEQAQDIDARQQLVCGIGPAGGEGVALSGTPQGQPSAS